ncbi:MAG TPA: iron ABC transporter permease [Dehalococcoidia bacterium]|jgi:iron complex transport system permease protein|nr:iron ABC transporter permease [Dehalococcoidia bacterium]
MAGLAGARHQPAVEQGLLPRLRPVAPALACVVLAACLAVGLMVGPAGIGPGDTLRVLLNHVAGAGFDVSRQADAIVWQIRLPRVLLAGVVGATLAFSGAAYQGVFRNPLADPYLLGVAAGAGLAGSLAIVLDAPLSYGGLSLLPMVSFAGAILAVLLAYAIAHSGGQTPNTTLILAGITISSVAVAAISYILILDSQNSSAVLSWLLGSFNGSGWRDLSYVLPYALPAAVVVFAHGRLLNVLQLDEQEAAHVGVDVQRTKAFVLLAASLATAAAVSVVGIIGFVGIVAPHVVRLLIGPDYRRLLPVVVLVGASFLILADAGARLLVSPGELPVGIVTSFVGAPFFLLLLRRQRRVYF